MEEKILELYSDEDIALLKQKIKRWCSALFLLAVTVLAMCLGMIAFTNTENAARMEMAVIAASTFAGWFVIYGGIFVVTVSRRELAHANMLHHENRQILRGDVIVTDECVRIKKSITARRVEVCADGKIRRLLVCETRAAVLASANANALHTAHGYVAAYEVSQ